LSLKKNEIVSVKGIGRLTIVIEKMSEHHQEECLLGIKEIEGENRIIVASENVTMNLILKNIVGQIGINSLVVN
jgi:hypothetical protein